MKRLLSILVAAMLLLTLAACAPDNIISPVTPEQEETDTPAENTQTPDETDTPAENTETPENTEQNTDEGTIKDDREENTGIRPTYDIDTNNTLTVKTDILKGKTLSLYVTEDGAFTAGDMSEKEWLAALSEEYGLNIRSTVRSAATLYSAQSIALKSGMKLDVITADMNDLAASLSLMKSASAYVSEGAELPFSASVFEKTGGKVFTGAGNTRMLWYNKNIITDDSPYTLSLQDSWTTEVLAASAISAKSQSVKFIECDNWIAFGSAGGETVTGLTPNGFTFSVTGEKSIASFAEFAGITGIPEELKTEDYGWTKGNTAFLYTDDPGKGEFEVSFAPIPRYGADGKAVAEYTGIGIGIPASATDESAQTAAVFATLWAARSTESRVDELLFDIGLENGKTEKYLELSESLGLLCNADAVIGQLFEGESIHTSLYAEPATVYNSFYKGYNRTQIIKERY